MSGIVRSAFSVVGKIFGFLSGIVGKVLGAFIDIPDYSEPTFDGSESPTFGFEAGKNTASEYMPVPIVYGKHRVAGNVIYFEKIPAKENNSMMELAVTVSEGEIESISDLKLENLNWEQYTSPYKSWDYWLGKPLQTWDAPDGGDAGEQGIRGQSRMKDPAVTTDVDLNLPETGS